MAHDDKKPEKKKAEQRALVPNAEGNVMVEAILGPYRGNRLTMPAAEGEQARDDHWVINPSDMESYDHPTLTDEERTASLAAAQAWAQAQWDTAQGVAPPPPPEGGVTRKRSMAAEEPAHYKTR
jgi:hypothetical protein